MQMGTCVWHLGSRRGRSIQRASPSSPWRWTPIWWQLKTPANLEVRPLCRNKGASSLSQALSLLPACLHSSYFPIPVSTLPLVRSDNDICSPSGWPLLSFPDRVHQASVLHVTALCVDWEMLWQHTGHLSSCQTLSVVSWSWLNLFSMYILHQVVICPYACFLWCVTGFAAWIDILTHSLLIWNLSLWLYFTFLLMNF